MPTNATAPRGGAHTPSHGVLYMLKQVQYKAFVRLERALQPLGITAVQFRIMSTLGMQAKLSSAQLARLYDVKPQTMIKQIVNLESNGLIERNLAKGSKRVLEVSMTEAGRVALRACEKAATVVEAEIFASFAPGELETYRALMEKILAGMRGTPDGAGE